MFNDLLILYGLQTLYDPYCGYLSPHFPVSLSVLLTEVNGALFVVHSVTCLLQASLQPGPARKPDWRAISTINTTLANPGSLVTVRPDSQAGRVSAGSVQHQR